MRGGGVGLPTEGRGKNTKEPHTPPTKNGERDDAIYSFTLLTHRADRLTAATCPFNATGQAKVDGTAIGDGLFWNSRCVGFFFVAVENYICKFGYIGYVNCAVTIDIASQSLCTCTQCKQQDNEKKVNLFYCVYLFKIKIQFVYH